MALLILRMGRRIQVFRRVVRAVAAWERVSDETRACSDSQDEMATCGRRGRAACKVGFSSGSCPPTMRAARVILKRAVRVLARGVEFPEMP